MKKLGRILRRVLTAVSLLLFVTVLVAWVTGLYGNWLGSWVTREDLDNASWRRQVFCIRPESLDGYIYFGWDLADRGQLAPQEVKDGVSWATGRVDENSNQPFWPPLPDKRWRTYEVMGISIVRVDGLGTLDGTQATKRPVRAYVVRWYIYFPCWMPALVFGALPSWRCFVWCRAARRRRLASQSGRCPVCGYDLRASPDRCPECGTPVETKDHPAATAATEKTTENSRR